MTFHNADTGFAVLKVKARGKRDLVALVGHAPTETLKTTPPTTAGGITRYLGSGMVRGIGPKLAERIVGLFGLETFEIIEANPDRLEEVPGIGTFRAGKIAAGWAEQKAVRDIMVFLHGHGVSTARAVQIFKTCGHDAIAVMTEDPYRLSRDIRGIGFRSADAIAMRVGLTLESPQRLRAGISYALKTATDEGHCALPVEELVRLAVTLLEVAEAPIRIAIEVELAGGDVILDRIEDEPCLFLRGLHSAERDIADRLSALASGNPPWPQIDAELAVPWVEARTGKILSASQRQAVDLVLRSKVSVVTGDPGVGKTTLLDTILRVLTAKGVRILLAAPTGRAAKRMSDQSGIEGKTIHRLLEIDPKNGGFRKGVDDPLECDLLVLDETSMVDVPLMNAITKAIPKRSGLLLVGDVDQLPSVGPGRVLADVIDSCAITVARLTEVFRQADDSRIVVNAHRINAGQMPEWPKPGVTSDFYFVECRDPENGAAKVVEIVRDRIPRRFGLDPIRDIQVLCPMQRGALGARALNADLQKALNPNSPARVEGSAPLSCRATGHADGERLRQRDL